MTTSDETRGVPTSGTATRGTATRGVPTRGTATPGIPTPGIPTPRIPTRGIPTPGRIQPLGRSLRWRREQLMAAGLDEFSAHRLASNGMVDVHEVIVARERGRSDDLAPRRGDAAPDGRARGE